MNGRCPTCNGQRWGMADGMNEPGPCADCNPDGKLDAPKPSTTVVRTSLKVSDVTRGEVIAPTERIAETAAGHDEPIPRPADAFRYCNHPVSDGICGKPEPCAVHAAATGTPSREERLLMPITAWRDLGYEGPLSHEQVVDALWKLGEYSPEGVAVERTVAQLRADLARAHAAKTKAENDTLECAAELDEVRADLARLTEQFDALTEAHAADTLTIGDLRVQLAEAKSDLAREHKRATEPPVVTRELARAREGRDKAEAERDALAERVRVAREALAEYGQHTPLCRGQEVNSCDCGLTQALGGRGRE